ncbi:MAG: hypothetical protein JWR54_3285, partial [Mucilaginibacter sp.]|nr:hypothetical protein [Mucilaginibacter sp.]
MKLQNRTARPAIAISIAALLTASFIASCQKDNATAVPTDSSTPTAPLGAQNLTQSLATTTIYQSSGPIVAKSNTTYSGLVIDLGNSSNIGFALNGVSNVHITNCKIINTKNFAINLYNCSNVTVDNCIFSNVGFGVYAHQSKTIKVNNNYILNVNGINTSYLGHAVQFDHVNGAGNRINYNRIENIKGVAVHPHDQISVY